MPTALSQNSKLNNAIESQKSMPSTMQFLLQVHLHIIPIIIRPNLTFARCRLLHLTNLHQTHLHALPLLNPHIQIFIFQRKPTILIKLSLLHLCSQFSTRDGSPPLVERVPSGVQFPLTNTQSDQFLPAQAQDVWNRDGIYNPDHSRVPPHRPATSNNPFDNDSASLPRSTQTTYATSQETMNQNEYRPLPVPPPEVPRQRSTAERRPSVIRPRPNANLLKGASDVRHRSQTAREYSYDHSVKQCLGFDLSGCIQ